MSGQSILHRSKSHLQNHRRLAAYGIKHSSNFSRSNLLVVVLVFGAIGSYILLTSSAASLTKVWDTDTDLNGGTLTNTSVSGTGAAAKLQLSTQNTTSTSANLWVDTTGGTCIRQATVSVYNDAQACSSIQTALAACTPGDKIIMKAGTYGAQTISQSLASPGCTVTAETGTTSGAISTSGSFYTIQSLTVDVGSGHNPGGWNNSGSNITFDNLYLHGSYVSVRFSGGSNVTWHGGELGQVGLVGGARQCGVDSEPVETYATNITIDGVTFHPQDTDHTANACSSNGFHLEMMRLDDGTNGLTLKNSKFDNGDHSDTSSIFITNVLGASRPDAPKNLTFQNNFFGTADNSTFGIHANVSDCSTFTFAYNTFINTPGSVSSCTTSAGMRWIGNLGPFPTYVGCVGTHTKNVWQDSLSMTCGSDVFVNGTRFATDALGLGGSDGFHLVAGSPAINKGESGGYCTSTLGAVDNDGGARPQGAACDAGADEFGASAPTGPGTYNTSGSGVYNFDAGQTAAWASLTDTQTTPTGTSVILESRSSADNNTWSSWNSGVGSTPANRYIQVRATLNTTDTSQTPSIDNITLGYTSAVDTVSPTVSLTSPAAGAVSGIVSVAANATDDVAVSSVQFKLDGSNLGAADTSSPYSVSWDTTTATAGSHSLTAVATDSSGNATTSAAVNVTVSSSGGGNGGTPTPVPAAVANGITVGDGFAEASARQVVRTAGNKVYVIVADDNPCQNGGSGVIRIFKGTGSQAGNPNIPTGFAEQDSSHHPVSAGNGSCIFSPGALLFSPDSRLDASGTIHMAYIDSSGGAIYYQTYSTGTDTWGARVQIGSSGETASGASWPRAGQVALTLDNGNVPHVVYTTNGSSNSVMYTNKTSGSWSTPAAIFSGTNEMHPSMVTSLDGTLHLTWLDNSLATHAVIKYAHRTGTSWGTVETVSSGDSLVLANGDDDQGPSITTDLSNRPHVLYMDGTVNGSDDYVRLRYRTSGGTWTDNTPSGSAGASNANGTWFAHTPQNYVSSAGDEYVFLGHDNNISPGVYQYQVGGPGNNWSAALSLDPRNKTNTTAGEAGIDGSASIRFDPLRDNNSSIIDMIYYDESDGTAGYSHHATVYYKALTLGSSGGGTTTVPGDTNNDGHVDIFDLSTLISNYNTSTASCDFNHDGTVNVFDLSILISNYGT